MPFKRVKAKLGLSKSDHDFLQQVSRCQIETVHRVERANILINYAEGMSAPKITEKLQINVQKVYLCINKALEFGVHMA